MTRTLQPALKRSGRQLAIWGIGYIGYSSMANFAREGINCIGYDKSAKVVDDILSNGKSGIPNIEYWLDFDVAPLTKQGLIKATTDKTQLLNASVAVHLIAVPTERHGLPYNGALQEVLESIFSYYNENKNISAPIVIIESTISPNIIKGVIMPLAERYHIDFNRDLFLSVAPRRDWFVSPDKTLRTLPRVVGGVTDKATKLALDALSIVCDNLLPAHDARHACLVKSVENAYRQLNITFANQLTLAYPDINMIEVLKLAGTKWNVETYHPSFGAGGYCIPLAPYYVIDGATKPNELSVLKKSIQANSEQPKRVADFLIKQGFKNIGILGLAYTQDIKVDILSPTTIIVDKLLNDGQDMTVKINDPLYSDKEIKQIIKTPSFNFPEELEQFDAILLVSPHTIYKSTPITDIIRHMTSCRLILDNMGAWRNNLKLFNDAGINYHEAGDTFWLSKPIQ